MCAYRTFVIQYVRYGRYGVGTYLQGEVRTAVPYYEGRYSQVCTAVTVCVDAINRPTVWVTDPRPGVLPRASACLRPAAYRPASSWTGKRIIVN